MSNIQATKSTGNDQHMSLHPLDSWEHFNKMFNDLQNRWPFQLMGSKPLESKGDSLTPNVDINESKKSYEISAELPGLDSKDISIDLADNVLTISGEKKTESSKRDEKDYHVMERHYGYFKRSFTLPNSVEQEKISADFKKGVLHVSLPKSEKAQNAQHKIPIKN